MTCDLACAIALAFSLSAEDAERHSFAATQAADESAHVDAELLVSFAYVETGLSQHPKHDTWACSKKSGKCAWFCGIGQVYAGRVKSDKRECNRIRRSLPIGYRALRKEVAWWLKNQGDDLLHAAAGHGCGYSKKPKTSLRCGQKYTPGHRRYKAPYPARLDAALRRIRARRVP